MKNRVKVRKIIAASNLKVARIIKDCNIYKPVNRKEPFQSILS